MQLARTTPRCCSRLLTESQCSQTGPELPLQKILFLTRHTGCAPATFASVLPTHCAGSVCLSFPLPLSLARPPIPESSFVAWESELVVSSQHPGKGCRTRDRQMGQWTDTCQSRDEGGTVGQGLAWSWRKQWGAKPEPLQDGQGNRTGQPGHMNLEEAASQAPSMAGNRREPVLKQG